MMEDEELKKIPTLCWKCRNAVPKMADGKLVRGCSWSTCFQPVKGWFAEEDVKSSGGSTPMKTYCVLACPEYAPDDETNEGVKDFSDDGYIRIAELVLKSQMQSYRAELEKYAKSRAEKHLAKVKLIERELLTLYYSALSLGHDMRAVIVQFRKEFGLPWEDVV